MENVCSWCVLIFTFVSSAKGFLVHGPAEPIVTRESGNVLLPCFVENPLPLEELEVVWKRTDSEAIVHLFQERESRPESQDPSYMDRAQFFMQEIPKGNFSLLLESVMPEDEGTYKCIVYTNLQHNETLVKMSIERLMVSGTDKPVYAHASEDVILQCSLDLHIPLAELEVEWTKTDENILVLLFSEGESKPESQNERYWDRAEFFTEEISKGNFSIKLRNVRTEDKGEYMCKVYTDTGSANVTVRIEELGFSSLQKLVFGLSIAVTPVAIIMGALSLWCFRKKNKSRGSLWIHCFHVTLPCLMISLAIILWGVNEGFKVEIVTVAAVNLIRILILFKMAPYVNSFPGNLCYIFKYMSFELENMVIVAGFLAGVVYEFVTKYSPDTMVKVLFGIAISGGLLMVICIIFQQETFPWLVFSHSGFILITSFMKKMQRLDYALLVLVTSTAIFTCTTIKNCSLRWNRNFYLCHIIFTGTFFILHTIFSFQILVIALENDKECSAKMCVSGFLCILIFTSCFHNSGNLHAIPHTIVYEFGATGLALVNSVTLAVQLILKAETGGWIDFRLLTLPFESLFFMSWFTLNLFSYWTEKKEKLKKELSDIIKRCCPLSRNSLRSRHIAEVTPLSSLPAEKDNEE
ncbi:uncharacterized protein LOC108927487 [Scleropages formosus]|uniref:uncharacterized protein LOC108927487 n=1 Tax=Scleropages formosus TaxID=113540 RepID=UPI000878CF79|nr:uncharacterized protein LOC108927487 [Scleropages formosus]